MSKRVFEPKHILDWYCMIYNWGGLQTKKIKMSGGCYEGLGFRSINNHWAGFPSKDDQVRLTSLCVLPRSFRLLCLDLLLNLGLLIELVEVVHNDGDRQRDAENSTNCTNLEKKGNCLILQLISTFQTKHRKERICQNHHKHKQCYNSYRLSKNTMIVIPLESSTTPWWSYRSYELPKPSDRIDVAVAHGGHRDNGPVERLERNNDFTELDYVESFMSNNSGIQIAFFHGIYCWMQKM